MINAFEIDFLPVGSGSKSGDAITFRIGTVQNNVWTKQYVFVIDGGTQESGTGTVKHIKEIYKTTEVERVFLTHPDGDHASGLKNIIENLTVGKVWMHRPWNHWVDCQQYIKDGRITRNSWDERLKRAYTHAFAVEQIAKEKKITIFRPTQGATFSIDGEIVLTVLGPSKDFYVSLLQASDKTPSMHVSESVRTFAKSSETVFEDMTFQTEHLAEEEDSTSYENDMSLVMLLQVAGQKVLFTGDSGTMGLYKVIQYAIKNQVDLKDLNLLQVPHHGSRHNLSKGILKYIHAPSAVISCAVEGAPKHPSPVITNALHRRNIKPFVTQGTLLNYRGGEAPLRTGLSSVNPTSFVPVFEITTK